MIKNSLKWKLTFIFTILFIGNMVILAFFIHQTTTNVIIKDSARFGELALNQANLNIERYLDHTKQFIYRLGVSAELQRWAATSPELKGQLNSRILRLEDEFIVPYYGLNDDIVSISIYNASNGNEHHFTKGAFFGMNYSVRNEAWFESVKPFEGVDYFVSMNDSYVDITGKPSPLHTITLIKRFGLTGELYVKIDIRPLLLQRILNDLRLGENGIGYIVDGDGQVIAHPDSNQLFEQLESPLWEPMLLQETNSFSPKDSDLIVIYDTIPDSKWRSVIQIPRTDIASSIPVVRNAVIVIALFNLIGSVPLIWLVSASLTKRLIQFKKSIVSTGQGNFHHPVIVAGNDEIAVVAQSYNRMLEELEAHVTHLSEARLMEQQAIMLSLQMQIDAHFLYNTLEIINAMAYKNKVEDVEIITNNLAQMLRYTVELRSYGTTIEREIEQLQRYLLIVGYRFGTAIHVEVIAKDIWLLQAESIKIALQPLAENSILHGGFDEDYLPKLTLEIALIKDGVMMVQMSDNGKGFSNERLAEVRQLLTAWEKGEQEVGRIGLHNIYKRLIKRWGSGQASLEVENKADGGAMITLTFPIQMLREDSNAAKSTHCR